MSNPYHVRLAISQYGDRFRAELFTEDLGDTDGELLPADWRDRFNEWMDFLESGGSLPVDTSRKIGTQLFDWLFSGTNRLKWVQVLERMKRDSSQPIRLLIDSTTATNPGAQDRDVDRIHNLPYGLLFDAQRSAFLFRPRDGSTPLQFVRIVRRTTPRLLNLAKPRWPLRVLIAAAEPGGLEFGGPEQLRQLLAGLAVLPEVYAVTVCTPDGLQPLARVKDADMAQWCRCTREQLATALRENWYDMLHLMAHGRSNGFLLCKAGGEAAPVDGDELSEWCRGKVQMGFLQVCKAARTAGQGVFGGLAQRLLNPEGGDLAAVVASPYLLETSQSTSAALAFYQQMAREELPDRAVRRDLEISNFGWAFLELWVRPSALRDTGARGAFQFVSPYRGLANFQERDADIFFGRDAEVAELTQILSRESLVAVVGDSGSGKSSLLQAGLAHTVRTQGLADRNHWRIVSLSPGTEPARSLMTALFSWEKGQHTDFPTPERLADALIALLKASCSTERPLLLLFDQFEEIFTLCKDEQQRQAVVQALVHLAQLPEQNARIVVGMRSDYLGKAVALPELGSLITRPWVLCPPAAAEIRAIVVKPAEAYGYRFQGRLPNSEQSREQPLLERILSDPLLATSDGNKAGSSAPLPLVGFALERLWLKAVDRGSKEFTHDDYEQMNGLSGAIAQHADEVYRSLSIKFQGRSIDAQRLAEFIFTSVVNTNGTRQPRIRQEVEQESGNAVVVSELIDDLVGERLLTIRSDPNDLTRSLVDIAHESLIKGWGKLQEWLQSDVQERKLREDFQHDSETFGQRNMRLPAFSTQRAHLDWLDRKKPSITDAQAKFADAMRKNVRLSNHIRVGIAIAVLVSVIAMAGLTILAALTNISLAKANRRLNLENERAVARAYVSGIGNEGVAIAEIEIDQFRKLKAEPVAIRYHFLAEMTANEGNALRLNRRSALAVHAAVGLDAALRQHVLDDLIRPYLSADQRSPTRDLAVVLLGAELIAWEHLPEFTPFARSTLTQHIRNTHDCEDVLKLSEYLSALPGSVSLEEFAAVMDVSIRLSKIEREYRSSEYLSSAVTQLSDKVHANDIGAALSRLLPMLKTVSREDLGANDSDVSFVFNSAVSSLVKSLP